MRRAAPLPLALLPCVLLLGACARPTDDFKPRIVVVQPDSGSVSRQSSLVVKGYVLDDERVASLSVNGQPLALTEGSAKIRPFSFRTQIGSGRAKYTLEARDGAGHLTTLVLPLQYDATPPGLTIDKVERDGTTIRLSGVATDNLKVASISVDGNRLSTGTGTRVPFFAETTGAYADVEVRDAAGNVTKKRVQ